jgi:hypothetical protein
MFNLFLTVLGLWSLFSFLSMSFFLGTIFTLTA